ncbi:Oligopeptide transporter 5 [Platanthera guangdongensis]|uniref:Oligopeptide transporter 5 n=1 Tax=Platanthera guangdongensis TaxID=2320717 RepID=A0ABR2LKN5_9ASPA
MPLTTRLGGFRIRLRPSPQFLPVEAIASYLSFSFNLCTSFAYYVIPNYLFPSISTLSFICWLWTNSVTMQQLGSGLQGLGIGAFAVDWSTVAGFLGSPLATPGFAIINVMFGFIMVAYVIIPLTYYNNAYHAKNFPIFSSNVYMGNGTLYNVNQILNQ